MSRVATETLIALHVAPGAKRRKTFSALLDVGASESLIAPELLVDMLKDHVDDVAKTPKSTWTTGIGKFEADRASFIENITLPNFTVNRKFPIKLTMLPKIKNGEHNQKCIIGLKDLMRLGFVFDLKHDQLKWDGIITPLVPNGF